MPECHVEWKQCKVVVPVSQLVLPVGVMGLTVNGKTPTPEPGSIVGTVRFKERHEDTHKVMIGSENSVQSHTQTRRGWNQCSWHAHGLHLGFFLGHSRQPAKDLSHLIYYKEKLSAANENLTPCNMSHPHWLDAHLGAPRLAKLQSCC